MSLRRREEIKRGIGMKNLFASLQLWKKFALLGVIGLALFGVPTVLYLISAEGIIAHKQLEVKGVNPARALLRTMQLMQQHRGMSAILIGGNAGVGPQRQAKAQEVDKAFQTLFEELKKNGVHNPAIEKDLAAVQSTWNGLRDGIGGGQVAGPQSFATHSDQISELFEINDLILDDFKLSLDADLDSSKLIIGAFVAFPLLTEELGKMRARGSALLAKKTATQEDKLGIIRPSQRGQERLKQADKLFQQAFALNATLKDSLGGTVDNARKLALGAIVLADEKVLKPEALDFPPQEYFAKFTDAIDAQFKVVDVVILNLESTLGKQVAQLRRDEIWVLGSISALALFAAWIGTMLSRSITVPISESVSMAQRVASCDLTSRAVVVGSDESAQLLHALNDMTGSLVNIVGDVRTSIDVIHVASKEIAMGNADLSNRTESQASSLEETASSMEDLTSTVRQNADNARQANSLVNSASVLAVKGGEVVVSVVQTMGSIKESSSKIVEIISVIDGIAFQTNILALNAAVEEIKELISDSVGKVDAGGRLVDEAGATMGEIVTSVKHVADIMGEITAASQEQSVGIEEVNRAITQMDEITQQNAALVEQAAAAAESLQEQADILAQAVSVFKITPAEGSATASGISSPRSVPTLAHASAPSAKRLAVTGKPAPVKKTAAPMTKNLPKPASESVKKPVEAGGNANEWEEF